MEKWKTGRRLEEWEAPFQSSIHPIFHPSTFQSSIPGGNLPTEGIEPTLPVKETGF
jgi:hypothetical protein